ncbi:MAG TPA: hypothetical protein VKX45_14435 [Bryobacteraceae bacterium]|nr:hypothetical protein [Bryobacteraceae bacterium]
MKLTNGNLQRLAPPSAAGAGTVFVTADRAEASAIVYSALLKVQVGWYSPNHFDGSYSHSFTARTGTGRLRLFSAGAVWGTAAAGTPGTHVLRIEHRFWSSVNGWFARNALALRAAGMWCWRAAKAA